MNIKSELIQSMEIDNSKIQKKLNSILDKVYENGLSNIDEREMDFLNSFKDGKEKEFYSRLSYKLYISDNSLFEFILTDIKDNETTIELIGEMTLPTMGMEYETEFNNIRGMFEVIKGDALIFPKFSNNGFTPYDFIYGMEFEFDNFVQNILEDIIEI